VTRVRREGSLQNNGERKEGWCDDDTNLITLKTTSREKRRCMVVLNKGLYELVVHACIPIFAILRNMPRVGGKGRGVFLIKLEG
jgi:hypothetical protein